MNLWLKFKDLTPHAIRSNQNQYTRTSAIISMVSSYLSLEIIKREREREKELVYVRERDWDKENKDRPKRSALESDRKSSEHAREVNAVYANYLCVLTLFCQLLCFSFVPTHSLAVLPSPEIYNMKKRTLITRSVKRWEDKG